MTSLTNCWKWITTHAHVHRHHAVAGHRRPLRFHHGMVRRPRASRWVWTCAAPPLFAIPPLAWVWHPFVAPGPVAAIAPPSDNGGYGGFDSGGSGLGYGAGLPSGIGVELIPSAFAGSPSLLNAPSLPGANCCTAVATPPEAAVSEPAGVVIMAVLLVVFCVARVIARRP